jgi:gluconokinase
MVILVMGVSGVGKTTVGKALARELGWRFADADEFHSPANVAKMHAGIPLTDADRAPWLKSLREAIQGWIAQKQCVVLACSALKEAYRRELIVGPEVRLVYLHGDFKLIAQRLAERHGHYMNPALLKSQFEALEVPKDAISADVSTPIPDMIRSIREQLHL